MNKERFEELKTQTVQTIRDRKARIGELQDIIRSSQTLISLQTQLRDAAREEGNTKSYAAAQTLIDMHTDRKSKAEEEQRLQASQPTVPGDLYNTIRSFLIDESAAVELEGRQEIRSHMDAIVGIMDSMSAYYHELAVFADDCSKANDAGFGGNFQNIVLSQFPPYIAAELKKLKVTLDGLS